ncbi:cell division protein ZapE [Vitreoscilla massiliensis]|uniref:Cell division protein ZapE n=1 Tax=Vitreoscilla massiliensis TaxID=1689272 RepID=A0ABY4DYJ8_9NEIS|nr:cell division protein ZapE [Vitreoscilla massiliensis]UOO88591.1 cell division protein ZapE [Vitreoscilla massiliensis]
MLPPPSHVVLNPQQQSVADALAALIKQPQAQYFYLWGQAGRGKTMLMDALLQHYPHPAKRWHLHQLMREIQQFSFVHRQQDAIVMFAQQLASQYRLLCLDEMHLHDVADTHILERLLSALLSRKTAIILTSNYPPAALLNIPGRQMHATKLIALIERHFHIEHLQGDIDYRQLSAFSSLASQFVMGKDAEVQTQLQHRLAQLGIPLDQHAITAPIHINGRWIPVLSQQDSHIWFDYEHICLSPRSYSDYLDIATAWPLIIISGLSAENLHDANGLRRFIWLIDVLYDAKRPLLLGTDAPILELLTPHAQDLDTKRLYSRLCEMQFWPLDSPCDMAHQLKIE